MIVASFCFTIAMLQLALFFNLKDSRAMPKPTAAPAHVKSKMSPNQHHMEVWRRIAKHARAGETGRAMSALAELADLQIAEIVATTPQPSPAVPATPAKPQ